MISLDLQDAYLQVPVHPQSRRYLRFCLGHLVYQFRVLCFGLSSSPQVFTRVMAPVSSVMHHSGFRILRYLDDWLVHGSSLQEITRARDFLLDLCAELLIHVNLPKSSLTPSQLLDYLQSSPLRAFPTQARVQKVRCLVDEFSSSLEQPLSLWRSLLGVMSSLSTLIPGSRLRMRSLQQRLLVCRPVASPTASVSWDDSCQRDLQWWSDPSHLVVGVDLSLPHLEFLLYTDASDSGWVTSLGSDHLSSWWSHDVSLFFHQPPRASGCLPCHSRFSPSPQGQDGVFIHRQHVGSVIPPLGGRHELIHAQLSGSGDSPPLRGVRCSSAPPVYSGSPECLGGLSQLEGSGPRFRMYPPSGGVPRSLPPLAGHGGFIHHLHQPSPSGLFFPDGRPSGGGGGCADPTLGSSAGLCLPSIQPYPEGPHQGPRLPQSRDDSRGSVLAAQALVSRSPRPPARYFFLIVGIYSISPISTSFTGTSMRWG